MPQNQPFPTSRRSDNVTPLLVRLPAVMRMTGLGRSTIYRMVAAHKFPSPVRLGARAVAWRQSDLDQWTESRPVVTH